MLFPSRTLSTYEMIYQLTRQPQPHRKSASERNIGTETEQPAVLKYYNIIPHGSP